MAKKTAEQLQEEIHARAAVVKKAYEDWKAANANNPYAMYTLEEQKKYLPKGFKNPKDYASAGGWQKAKELGLDAYDQYGNIITRESMAPSWIGDAIGGGQYLAPNVTAAAISSDSGDLFRARPDFRFLGIFQNLIKPYTPPEATIPKPIAPPAATTPPPGTPTGSGNVADAAKNLASVTQPTVPNFIQPYGGVNSGFKKAFATKHSFGESDIF